MNIRVQIFALIFLLALIVSCKNEQNSKTTDEMKKSVLEINKLTPIEVDNYINLDSASSNNHEKFTYYYSILGLDKSEINAEILNEKISPTITNYLERNIDLGYFKNNNILLRNKIYDRKGIYVTDIIIK